MDLMSKLFTFSFLITPLSLGVFCAFKNKDVHVCSNNRTYSPQYFSVSSICYKAEGTVKLFKAMTEWEQIYSDIHQEQILLQHFPIDPEKDNYIRRVKNVLFSAVNPTPLQTKLRLVAVSKSALELLDMSADIMNCEKFVKFASGNHVPPSTVPLAHRYGGHQFGSWAGQLGDGRAVMLGEFKNSAGERWEMQLKGSGKTPYSRQGDGRAVLRSSVREFLCSEALHYLGIPTSRAASLVVSEDPVIRDPFYSGNIITERAAVVLRLAKSWFRFGSLEILSTENEIRLLQKLLDFIIEQYFPAISTKNTDKYLEFYSTVVQQTAELVAKWQSVGFAHGVCNTDNFSILSVTIDFGPFGFLDHYDPGFIPNTSDDEGRYSYDKQPDVGYFNLDKLRLSISPLLGNKQKSLATDILKGYTHHYKQNFMYLYGNKFGVPLSMNQEDDENLVAVFLKMMEETQADYTMGFRQLGQISIFDLMNNNISESHWALKTLSKHKWFQSWIKIYAQILGRNFISDDKRRNLMLDSNPRYILRNWIAQTAIGRAENNDFSYVRKVLDILSNPYVEQREAEHLGFARKPPMWASSLKVSCSS